MPSVALTFWQNDRQLKLALVDQHCFDLFNPNPPAPPPPLAQQSLEGYVVLVSGHFQGFCRDLYAECVQICAAVAPPSLRDAIQFQFLSELKLDAGNPTNENIRKDFGRFGSAIDLIHAAPGNDQRLTDLGQLKHWRNAVSHQHRTPPPAGIPAVLSLSLVRIWLASCAGLATSLDDIMRRNLTRITGTVPW